MSQSETVLESKPGFLQETINGIKNKIYVFGDGLRSLNPFNKTKKKRLNFLPTPLKLL